MKIEKDIDSLYINMPSAYIWKFINKEKYKKVAIEKAILLNYVRIGVHQKLKNNKDGNIYKKINGKTYPCVYNTAKEIRNMTLSLFCEDTVEDRLKELVTEKKIVSTKEDDMGSGHHYNRKFYSLYECEYGEESCDFLINAYPIEDTDSDYKSNLFTLGTLEDFEDYEEYGYEKKEHKLFKTIYGEFSETVKKVGLINAIVAEVIYNIIDKAEKKEESEYNLYKNGYHIVGLTVSYLKNYTKLSLLKMTSNDICKALVALNKNNLIGFYKNYEDTSSRFVYIPEN